MKNLLPSEPSPQKTAEHTILDLARTRKSFTRADLEKQLALDGVMTCYEWALDKCCANDDIVMEDLAGGVWRSRIYRGAQP